MKKIIILLMLIALLVLPSVMAATNFQAALSKAGDVLNEFVSHGYRQHEKAWDFIIFFILFTAIAMVGLGRVTTGNWGATGSTGAVKAMAVAIGLALTFAAIQKLEIAKFFFPFARNILFFALVLLLFGIYRQMGVQSIFWALVLAAITTFVLFGLYYGMTEGITFESAKETPELIQTETKKAEDTVNKIADIDKQIEKIEKSPEPTEEERTELDKAKAERTKKLKELQDRLKNIREEAEAAKHRNDRGLLQQLFEQTGVLGQTIKQKVADLSPTVDKLITDIQTWIGGITPASADSAKCGDLVRAKETEWESIRTNNILITNWKEVMDKCQTELNAAQGESKTKVQYWHDRAKSYHDYFTALEKYKTDKENAMQIMDRLAKDVSPSNGKRNDAITKMTGWLDAVIKEKIADAESLKNLAASQTDVRDKLKSLTEALNKIP